METVTEEAANDDYKGGPNKIQLTWKPQQEYLILVDTIGRETKIFLNGGFFGTRAKADLATADHEAGHTQVSAGALEEEPTAEINDGTTKDHGSSTI